MVKAKLGLKRICQKCATKYYDMKKNPPVCPSCGTEYSAKQSKSASLSNANKDFNDDLEVDIETSADVFDDELDDTFDVESDSNVLKEKDEQ